MRLAAVALIALAAAGCAEPKRPPVGQEFVAVLPAADGHVGGVVVRSAGSERVLDQPFAANRIRTDGASETARASPEEIQKAFSGTLEALPGRPTSFLLYFLEGKDELTSQSRAELDKVFGELKRRPAPDIVVIGHTAPVGWLSFNDKLSLARAERVREMLIGLGIAPGRIQVAGRGKRELVVATEDNTPEPRNRRVEINVR
jgi:outer membrane protein OmpA-like peptidoglycan-associated protein